MTEPITGAQLWIVDDRPVADNGLYDPNHTVLLGMMPEMMVEFEKQAKEDVLGDYVDYVAGYMVLDARPSTHDGQPATTITLFDSMGGREVGILRLRNDANRDAFLEVTRYFVDAKDVQPFRESLAARPAQMPPGFEYVEARTVTVGDEIWVEYGVDPSDPESPNPLGLDGDGHALLGEAAKVESVRIDVADFDGKPEVHVWIGYGAEYVSDFSDPKPDEKIWVKRKTA
jgi:hypothetical protein